MSKVLKNEASIYNGVSQQNNELRLDSQCASASNTRFSVAHGLEKRPACLAIGKYSDVFGINSKVHPIDIADGSKYLLVFSDDTGTTNHKAFGIDGVEYKVITQDANVDTYLNTSTPDADLRLTTILSTTLVTNRKKVITLGGTLSPSLGNEQYLWVKNGVQQVERTLTVDGISFIDAKNANNDTARIIVAFDDWVNNTLTGYTSTIISDAVMKIAKDDTTAFDFEATDSYGDTTMEVAPVQGSVRDSLPPKASDNEVIKIVSDGGDESIYYLKYDQVSKSWFETVGAGIATEFNASTMPHRIVLLEDTDGTVTGTIGEFYFYVSRITWEPRTTGDEDGSPNPSFVGQTINDVFYFKNRLGFLSTESCITSATDDIYRMWPTSVKEVLDDDPVDLSVSTVQTVNLQYSVPFPDSMAIIGDNQQFSLHSDNKPFTPTNATVDNTTSYNVSDLAKPQAVGSSIYMTLPMDSFSAVREYAVVPDSLITEAVDVTGHVPRYVPNDIKQIIPERNLEFLFLVDKEDPIDNKYNLWVYSFFWQGNQKVQSAWSTWDFWFRPIGGWVFDGKLYMLGTETIDGVDSTILTKLGLETKSVEIEDYTNSEPLVDRLELYPDEAVVASVNQSRVEVSQDLYDTVDAIEGATFTLCDRVSGDSGDFVSKFAQDGKYYIVFDLQLSNAFNFYESNNNTLVGYHKIGGID